VRIKQIHGTDTSGFFYVASHKGRSVSVHRLEELAKAGQSLFAVMDGLVVIDEPKPVVRKKGKRK
jgi:hypothetical protein